MGHPDVTVVLHAKGSVHVLQMLSMSCNALQSTLSCMLLVLLESWPGKEKCSFEDNEIPLVRTSYLSTCVDMEGAPSPWCCDRNSKTRHVFKVTSWRARTEWCSAAVCGFPPCVGFSSQQDKQGLPIHLVCWELTANVMFPATLAAQLYQNTNLVSQQLSKVSLPMVSSIMARGTNVGHVSGFQLSPNSHILCSCCLNQIQRLN